MKERNWQKFPSLSNYLKENKGSSLILRGHQRREPFKLPMVVATQLGPNSPEPVLAPQSMVAMLRLEEKNSGRTLLPEGFILFRGAGISTFAILDNFLLGSGGEVWLRNKSEDPEKLEAIFSRVVPAQIHHRNERHIIHNDGFVYHGEVWEEDESVLVTKLEAVPENSLVSNTAFFRKETARGAGKTVFEAIKDLLTNSTPELRPLKYE